MLSVISGAALAGAGAGLVACALAATAILAMTARTVTVDLNIVRDAIVLILQNNSSRW